MKRLMLCFLLLSAVQLTQAQYYKTDTVQKRGFDASRLIIGGNLGLSFGDFTNINISPMVGYRISQLFAAGLNIRTD